MSNRIKSQALGMSHGKAANKLRKIILFSFICYLNLNKCYRCEKQIKDIEDLSIEHKTAWLHAEDPYETFFDLNNIAFSHLKCNIRGDNEPYPEHLKGAKLNSARHKRHWLKMSLEERKKNRRKRYIKYGC